MQQLVPTQQALGTGLELQERGEERKRGREVGRISNIQSHSNHCQLLGKFLECKFLDISLST